jgi:tetratricopeptide (TPR) repeat protein
VAAGRCLPYGDGLTWWPLAEALGAPGLLERAAADAEDAAARVSDLLEPAGAPVAPEEARWAVRKVLEALARTRPLVLVVDDLQWAEPAFVDVIEHIADLSRDVPLLLLIMARPELLDARPGWGGGKPNATSVLLEPLGEEEAADLLRHLVGTARLGERAAGQILDVAEGNPLYVEEIVAMLADEGVLDAPDGDLPIAVPPTIQALLAARLDRLDDGQRVVIEAAAIEGKEFARERVEALVGDEMRARVDAQLLALVRMDVIRPVGAGEGAFRFRHQLIRDAAYDGTSKDTRAALHERFADRMEEHRSSLASVDELLGHHLERAVLLRRELGAGEAATAGLAARASASLQRAGRRAADRGEPGAAARLLERALALAPDAERPTVLVELAGPLHDEGELLRAAATAREAVRLARAAGDRRTAARARIAELNITMGHTEADTDAAAFEAAVKPLISGLEELDDDEGLTAGLRLMSYIAIDRYADATAYIERAIVHAERAGNRLDAVRAAGTLGLLALFGPVPAAEAVERCRALREGVAGHLGATAGLLRYEAVLLAMQGDIDEARALHDEADDIAEDLGIGWLSASTVFTRTLLELLAGAPARAERAARAGLEAFEAMQNRNQGSTAAALLGVALVEQGRDDEALEYADLAAAWAMPDDTASQTRQLAVRARVLARRGKVAAGEAAARAAVAQSKASDDLSLRGDALVNLAFVLERAGRADEAADALREALALYERKGNVVAGARARALMESERRRAGVTDT